MRRRERWVPGRWVLGRGYRWIEYAAFGRALERMRFEYLGHLARARRVLMMGEGDGRALARLLEIAPAARIDVIERSPEMVRLARARAGDSDRVNFICEDLGTVDLPLDTYDAATAFFILDCFGTSTASWLVRRIERSLVPGGILLVSDFAIPPKGWKHWHARIWIGTMYLFFRITTGLQTRVLPPIETLLSEAGLRRTGHKTERGGMIFAEIGFRSRLS